MSFYKYILSGLLLAVSIVPAQAQTPAETTEEATPWYINGSLTVASEYMTRGFSDSNNKPALQGGIVLGHASGWEAEIWSSNVDYNDSHEAKAEVDFYLSYTLEAGPGDLSLGAAYYIYPGADQSLDYDHHEFFALYKTALQSIGDFGAELWVSPDILTDAGTGVYINSTADIPLGFVNNLSLVGSLGYQWIDDNARFGVPDYAEGSLGLAYTYEPFVLDVRYYDSSLSQTTCDNVCGPTVAGSLTWNW